MLGAQREPGQVAGLICQSLYLRVLVLLLVLRAVLRAFFVLIGCPQQMSWSVSQPHSSQTVTAKPQESQTSVSPFFAMLSPY
jgi:hypothetical protein